MSGISRVTDPLLDVLEVFLGALRDGPRDLHGWAIMKETKRSGPTVYGVLDRLEEAGWVTSRWEEQPAENKPRRRFYTITPNGRVAAASLLAERRPSAVQSTPQAFGRPGLAGGV
ncbi:PadR family transcriptional regulator [Streptomyces sp. NPDC000878]